MPDTNEGCLKCIHYQEEAYETDYYGQEVFKKIHACTVHVRKYEDTVKFDFLKGPKTITSYTGFESCLKKNQEGRCPDFKRSTEDTNKPTTLQGHGDNY